MASELEAQQLVHSLEHGRGRWWVWLLVALFGTAALFIVHIWINPLNQQGGQAPFFRGLTDARGMEQAVIARDPAGLESELARSLVAQWSREHRQIATWKKLDSHSFI